MTSRTVERIRRDGRAGEGRVRRREKRGEREERRGLYGGESERYRIITLAFFLFSSVILPSPSPPRPPIRLSILLRTSRVSLFNDCGTTIDITRREWTSNEPVTPSVRADDGRSFDSQGYCRHFAADAATIEHEIARYERNVVRTYIVGFVNYSTFYN